MSGCDRGHQPQVQEERPARHCPTVSRYSIKLEERALLGLNNHGNSSSSSLVYVTLVYHLECAIAATGCFVLFGKYIPWRPPLRMHASFLVVCLVFLILITIRAGTIELLLPHSSVRQRTHVVFI